MWRSVRTVGSTTSRAQLFRGGRVGSCTPGLRPNCFLAHKIGSEVIDMSLVFGGGVLLILVLVAIVPAILLVYGAVVLTRARPGSTAMLIAIGGVMLSAPGGNHVPITAGAALRTLRRRTPPRRRSLQPTASRRRLLTTVAWSPGI